MAPIRKVLQKYPTLKRAARFPRELKKNNEIQRYNRWLSHYLPTEDELNEQRTQSEAFLHKPLISIVTPTYNTPRQFFIAMVESVLGQTYENWQLVLVDDASPNSEVRDLIREYANKDTRIVYKFLEQGKMIAGATNEAIKLSQGDYISLFDHDDIIYPNTLFEIVKALNTKPELEFIYTDEDKISGNKGVRQDPFFKTVWNQDLLYSANYITHFTTIKRSLLDKVGYEDSTFDGAQDWELFLRITRTVQPENICHIPKVLYSWRVHENSTANSLDAKPYVVEAQRLAISEDIKARGIIKDFSVVPDPLYNSQWIVEQECKVERVMVMVPTHLADDRRVLQSAHNAFPRQEVTITSYDALSQLTEAPDIIVYTDRPLKRMNDINLLADVFRSDIGVVVGQYRESQLKSLLEDSIVEAVSKIKPALTMHYYKTARYNLAHAYSSVGVALFSDVVDSIESISRADDYTGAVHTLAESAKRKGRRHLYNPHVTL